MSSFKSESIAALAAALAKAQGEIDHAIENSENPHFRSTYADLSSIWDACRSQLSKNQLAVIQTTDGSADGASLITTLVHSSGEWIQGRLTLHPVKVDPQGIGSAITYARRYALAAMVGVAPIEDDDGEAAHGRHIPPIDTKPKASSGPIRPSSPTPPKKGAECIHEWAKSRYNPEEEYCKKRCGAKRAIENDVPDFYEDPTIVK